MLVGVLFLPIEIGIVLMTSPLRLTVSVLVLSSTVAMTSSPIVKCVVTSLLAEQSVAQVDAVGVDRDVDRRARLPVIGWAPTHFAVVQPVEGALDRRVGGDCDGLLRRQPVRDVLVERIATG